MPVPCGQERPETIFGAFFNISFGEKPLIFNFSCDIINKKIEGFVMRFPDDARVCFIGDSLTAHNQILPRVIDHYNKYFADADVRFFNCGTSGGTYQTAVDFFYDDVLPHRPTHAVVAFGVNDSGRWWLGQPRCDARYQKLLSYYHIFQSKLKEYYYQEEKKIF